MISEGTILVPDGLLTRADRADLAMNNPVAFVLENKILLNDILSTLIGLDPEDHAFYGKNEGTSTRKTYYYKARKGIFGHPLYAIGVTEDHSRGTLHWHISILAGLTPYALQRFSNLDGVCQQLSKVLDSMYTSRLDEKVHIGHLIRSTMQSNQAKWSISHSILESIEPTESLLADSNMQRTIDDMWHNSTPESPFRDAFFDHACLLASYKQHHRHLKTCHKGDHGKQGCRFDLPRAPCAFTEGVGLLPTRPPPIFSQVHQPRNSWYCQPCRTPESLSHCPKPYTVHLKPKQKGDVYRQQRILDNQLPEYVTMWEPKSPALEPKLLPLFQHPLPSKTALLLAFDDIR